MLHTSNDWAYSVHERISQCRNTRAKVSRAGLGGQWATRETVLLHP